MAMESANWYALKTCGRETRAMGYLRRAGVTAFWPETHKYFVDRRTRVEKHRVVGTFPGYVFIRPANPVEFSRARHAIGVAYVLGTFTRDAFIPKPIEDRWVEGLIAAGPIQKGRKRVPAIGEEVEVAIGAIGKLIGQVGMIDKRSKIGVKIEMFGRENIVRLSPERLEPLGDRFADQ